MNESVDWPRACVNTSTHSLADGAFRQQDDKRQRQRGSAHARPMLGSTYLRVKREVILREPQDERSDDRYTCAVQLEERDPLGWVMKALREAGNSVANELLSIDEEARSAALLMMSCV